MTLFLAWEDRTMRGTYWGTVLLACGLTLALSVAGPAWAAAAKGKAKAPAGGGNELTAPAEDAPADAKDAAGDAKDPAAGKDAGAKKGKAAGDAGLGPVDPEKKKPARAGLKDPVAMAFTLPKGCVLNSDQQKKYDELKAQYEQPLRDALDKMANATGSEKVQAAKEIKELRMKIKEALWHIVMDPILEAQQKAAEQMQKAAQQHHKGNARRGGGGVKKAAAPKKKK